MEGGITPLHPRRGKGERKEGWWEWMMHNMLVWRRRRKMKRRRKVRENTRGGKGENKDVKRKKGDMRRTSEVLLKMSRKEKSSRGIQRKLILSCVFEHIQWCFNWELS